MIPKYNIFFLPLQSQTTGELSEWLKEPASKTGVRQRTGGSNPSLTAVTVDIQPIQRFTHKPAHTKAKFVRISIVRYPRKPSETEIGLLWHQNGDCALILAAESRHAIKKNTHRLDLYPLPSEAPIFFILRDGDSHLARAVPFRQESLHSSDAISFAGISQSESGIQTIALRFEIWRDMRIDQQLQDATFNHYLIK